MDSISLTFESPKQRNEFLQVLEELASDNPVIAAAVPTVQLGVPVTKDRRYCTLVVGGRTIEEGEYSHIDKSFQRECAGHSGRVEIREYKNGAWRSIRTRNPAERL